jgi:hypothetical protein
MVTVTDIYKNNIYVSPRQINAKVIFEILDVGSNKDATISVIGESIISKKDQTIDLVRDMTAKYATFENNYWKLDGTFVLPPKSTEEGYQLGWWSQALSQSDGTFAAGQTLTANFSLDRSSIGITIIFDTQTNEYADSFTIQAYDSTDVLINSISVVGNTLTKYKWYQNLDNYRKIVITVGKWCNPYRRVRITEVDFGIIEEYTDTEIINLDVLEEIDLTSNTISSNEMSLTLNNQDKLFNIINPTGIYKYLERRQKFIPYYGLYINDEYTEYIPMGIYYLTEWSSDEGALTATFTARDVVDLLGESKLQQTTYTNKSLKFIIDEIMSATGITDYTVDTALESILITGTIEESTYREALQLVAFAGKCIVYPDRNGVLHIKQLTASPSVDTIGYSDIFNSPKITLDKLINTINIKYNNKTQTYTLTDPDKPVSEPVIEATVENPLIYTLAHAQDIAAWLLSEFKKRYLYEINWRMNPALQVGDVVTIQDDYSENKTAVITKNDFKYEGYLSGTSNAKGGGT